MTRCGGGGGGGCGWFVLVAVLLLLLLSAGWKDSLELKPGLDEAEGVFAAPALGLAADAGIGDESSATVDPTRLC